MKNNTVTIGNPSMRDRIFHRELEKAIRKAFPKSKFPNIQFILKGDSEIGYEILVATQGFEDRSEQISTPYNSEVKH